MKIIYAGTPEFSVPALELLAKSSHKVVGVYTQPDRQAGRGRKIQYSAVKQSALELGLEVFQPQSFKDPAQIQQLDALFADLMVVAAYGILLPSSVLEAPTLGCVNIHASLLPRWRGAAPIQRAILAGDKQTGITLMQMDKGLDTGDMLAIATTDIKDDATASSLHDDLMLMGAELLMQTLPDIESGRCSPVRQDERKACYAQKLTKQEAEIDWQKPAQDIQREIRAFNPWPVSFTYFQHQNVKLWQASFTDEEDNAQPGTVIAHTKQSIDVSCGKGVLRIKTLQFAGKKQTTADQLLNSRNLNRERFGA